MATRNHCCFSRSLAFVLLAGAAACVQASGTSVTFNATVLEIQCTAEQRTRIRACAPAQEKYTTEPRKVLVGGPSRNGGTDLLVPSYEIRSDPDRRVLIKTVLY